MVLKNYFASVVFLVLTFAVNSQNPNRLFLGFTSTPETIRIQTNEGQYEISAYNQLTIETSFIPNNEQKNAVSHAVIQAVKSGLLSASDAGNKLIISTTKMRVEITKSPFQISYFLGNKLLSSEKIGYTKIDKGEAIEFNLTPDEIVYGGGARALGMNRRGNRLALYNKAHYGYENKSELMNYTLPIVFSSEKYLIHFDNAPIGTLDLDSKHNNTLVYETIGGRKTYQIIAGENWEEIIENYTALTGRQPLPPRWAFGNFASRFGYHSEQEVRSVVTKFQQDSIPLDAVILDLYWFGKEIQGTLGNLEFYKDSFPTPHKMIDDFASKNIKTVLITEPFILTTSKKWQEAVDKKLLAIDSLGNPFVYNFYFGNTGLLDIYSAQTKSWFWDIYFNLTKMGVKGFWGDLGEPEVHPSALRHATGTADELHNVYGHDWAKLIQEGYQSNLPNERPFILMRAGAAGSQRFGMIPWSGDVNRSWGGLKVQPEISLQMGLQGIAYMHSDLGGFAGDIDDRMLYIRWLQYGVFQPIFRPHAQESVPSEVVFKDDKTKQIVKKAIQLRYKLLPYNYTIAFENSQLGHPLMRPLFYEEPSNTALYENSSTYLWGKDILVSPVLSNDEQVQSVDFPTTANWVDFYTDSIIKGGTTAIVQLSIDHIPTYIRAGAFIPLAEKMKATEDYGTANIDIHFYYNETLNNSSGQLYEDDGITPNNFETKRYRLISMNFQKNESSRKIQFNIVNDGIEINPTKSYNLIIHGVKKAPKKVLFDKKKRKFTYNSKTKTLSIPLNLLNSKGELTF
jgi:alpha-glucosidase/oligosaccharide 4-alpha-D-glucosyltransferase